MASETKLDPRDRLAVMVSMAGSYIESGRGADALAVMRTVAEDVATEITRLTREWYAEDAGLVVEGEAEERCAVCGHKWSQHDPADGRCDSASENAEDGAVCPCGRDLAWMQRRIARLSKRALEANADRKREALEV